MPVDIHGQEYATVKERLEVAHGDGIRPTTIRAITTEVTQVGTTSVVVVRAVVEFEGGRGFVGHAQVDFNATGPAERDAPLETAETSAIGRALQNAGYWGSSNGVAGAEELRIAERRRIARETRERAGRSPGASPSAEPQQDGGPMPWDEEEAGDAAPRPAAQAPRTYGPRGDANPRQGGGQQGGPPATEKQIDTIQRMSRAAGREAPDTDGMSRQRASEIISELIAEMGQSRG